MFFRAVAAMISVNTEPSASVTSVKGRDHSLGGDLIDNPRERAAPPHALGDLRREGLAVDAGAHRAVVVYVEADHRYRHRRGNRGMGTCFSHACQVCRYVPIDAKPSACVFVVERSGAVGDRHDILAAGRESARTDEYLSLAILVHAGTPAETSTEAGH